MDCSTVKGAMKRLALIKFRSRKNSWFIGAAIGCTILLGAAARLVGAPGHTAYRLASGNRNGFYAKLGATIAIALDKGLGRKEQLRLLETKGSTENLRLLKSKQADLALVQYDVAKGAVDRGEVKPIAVIAEEQLFVIARDCQAPNRAIKNSNLFITLASCSRIAIGEEGSGINFTSRRLLLASGIAGRQHVSSITSKVAVEHLLAGKIGSLVYIGAITSRQDLIGLMSAQGIHLRGLGNSVVNYLVSHYPDVYHSAMVLPGAVSINPVQPESEIRTVSVPTVLLARSDLDRSFIKDLAWSLVSNYSLFLPYYPSLMNQDPGRALAFGLAEIDPDAANVYQNGDPSKAFWRIWEDNSDLQAGTYILLVSSFLGYGFQAWRKRRSASLVTSVNTSLLQISEDIESCPSKSLLKIEQLLDDIRLKYIGNRLGDEAYTLVSNRVQSLAEKCRIAIDTRKKESVLNTLVVFDQWQAIRFSDPVAAKDLIYNMKSKCREMLLAGEIDIAAYIELMELSLLAEMAMTNPLQLTSP